MLHPHTAISVSQQSVAEQLVETYCSVNCIGIQMPSHLWINIHHGKRVYKEAQGLWHSALRLPRAPLPDGAEPTSSGHPIPASMDYRGFTVAKKAKNPECLKDMRVLKASSIPGWPGVCHQGTWKIDYCMLKWRKALSETKKVNGKGTAQPQWDFEPYPSMCIGCKSVILHQSCAAQEKVNAGNETQDFIWHVLTEYIDMLHKILWKEITCVSSSINACPITTQSFDNGPVNTGATNICLSLKYIMQVYYKTPKIKPGTYFNTDQGDTMGLKWHVLRPESFCKTEFAASFHLAHLGKHRGLNPGIIHKVLSILWHAKLFRHLAAMPSVAVAWNLPLRFWGGQK